MADEENYIYAESDWRLIDGPFTVKHNKWHHSLKKRARRLRRCFFQPAGRVRERAVEYPLVVSTLGRLEGRCRVADVGGASSMLGLNLVYLGHEVHVLDLRRCPLKHPDLHAQQVDVFDNGFPESYFDAISCISVIEHVGIARYGGIERQLGDLALMHEMQRLCRPDGLVVLSGPYGSGHEPARDGEPRGYRIYDRERLSKLVEDFKVESLRFFVMEKGCWREREQKAADGVVTSRPIDAIFFAELRVEK